MYRTILFDLDGTLTASGEGITRSVQYAMSKFGIEEPDLRKLEVFIGPPLLEQFMKYCSFTEEQARQAIVYYRERYENIGIFENAPYPGIKELLGELRDKGYKLGVASSKPEHFVIRVLDHFGMTGYFHEIVGAEMDGRRTQKGEVIEEALRRFKMEEHRNEVIMVGDKEHDVYGARERGLKCIAVTYGYGTTEELTKANPYYFAESVEKLRDFFSKPLAGTVGIPKDFSSSLSCGNSFSCGTDHRTFPYHRSYAVWQRGNRGKCTAEYGACSADCNAHRSQTDEDR